MSMKKCRICEGRNLHKFLSLGRQPHCNRFLREQDLALDEPAYPLDLYFCDDCALVQLGYVVPPEKMFRDYPYVSGTTATLPAHFQRLAQEIVARFDVPRGSLVADIGSNDGTFLRGFQQLGMRVLGFDPAVNIAALANEAGIETVPEFFDRDVSARAAAEKGKAKVITAAGVFYHVPDLPDFVEGVRALLADDGIFVVQAIYLLDMIEKTSFDNVYHEHLCYYSLKPLTVLFNRFNMEVFEVERAPIHGGSIIVYVRQGISRGRKESVEALLAEEARRGLYSLETYQEFACRVAGVREKLVSLLRDLRAQGKGIAAYGAPAKGNTMLNYCRIGPDVLRYAAEKNPLKQGLYTPGMHIPVIAEEKAREDPPDYYLVLPWNFLDEFLEKEREFRERGGRFIVPIPEPHIV
ncbi:MAG: class I SAM-dependent methyltransferase [Chloroflexi bacterium]|nr:class I SAM-dependent methyltransferase [Chloroflexota bacterium]